MRRKRLIWHDVPARHISDNRRIQLCRRMASANAHKNIMRHQPAPVSTSSAKANIAPRVCRFSSDSSQMAPADIDRQSFLYNAHQPFHRWCGRPLGGTKRRYKCGNWLWMRQSERAHAHLPKATTHCCVILKALRWKCSAGGCRASHNGSFANRALQASGTPHYYAAPSLGIRAI